MFKKKNDTKKIKVAVKEGEKIYRKVENEETGEVTYEELNPDKKEETEEEKAEKVGKKVVIGIGVAALAAGAYIGSKFKKTDKAAPAEEKSDDQGESCE